MSQAFNLRGQLGQAFELGGATVLGLVFQRVRSFQNFDYSPFVVGDFIRFTDAIIRRRLDPSRFL